MKKNQCAWNLVIAAAVLAALPAGAQELLQVPLYGEADTSFFAENTVEIGILLNDEDSYKFGEFTGLRKNGGYTIANIHWGGALVRSQWELTATNLGLPSRRIALGVGRQARWSLDLGFDQLTRYQWDDTQFIHEGLGSAVLTLPGAFTGIPGQPPANAGAINPFLTTFAIEQGRDVYRLGAGYHFARDWEARVDLTRLSRDGNRLIGAVVGNTGGNPRAVLAPYRLDDGTDQGEVSVLYRGQDWQLDFGYRHQKYDTSTSTLTWDNPFINAAWAGPASFPNGQGLIELHPDNSFQQFQVTGGFSFAPNHRITATGAYGLLEQDQAFQDYTINPGLSVTTPLPRSSLDGKIGQTLLDVSYHGRPAPKWNLRVKATYNDHDNSTPTAQYLYVGGDSMDQPASPVGSNRARINTAFGTTETRLRASADHRIARGTIVGVGYQYRKIDYEPAEQELRRDVDTTTYDLYLRRTMSSRFTGTARYQRDERRGSDFSVSRPFSGSYDPTYVATSEFDNLPTIRHFYVADYDRNAFKLIGNLHLSDDLDLQVHGNWFTVDYEGPDCGGPNDQVYSGGDFPAECLGRTQAEGRTFTADLRYAPQANWSSYVFFTRSRMAQDQAGRQYQGSNLPQALLVTRNWFADLDYLDDTIGVGADFHPAGKAWSGGAQFLRNDATSRTAVAVGSDLTAGPVPDAIAQLDSIQFWSRVRVATNLSLRANLWIQELDATDWAYDNATPTSSNNVLLAGQATPQYRNKVAAVSLIWTK